MNLSRIALGLILIVGASGAVVSGTSAFFSDTETSRNNIFTAGSIDLLVDNTSYATDPETGLLAFSEETSWPEGNLNDGEITLHKFFDFTDLKPDDEGEDTISLHTQNDAYACMDVRLTSNDDNGTNEPELDAGDTQDDGLNPWDGELAQNIQMFWWSDDGDNVYEEGEATISGGIQTLHDLATSSGSFSVALADSEGSVWDTPTLPANVTKYIAKAWCFGTLSLNAVPGDGGVDPLTDPGVLCDGSSVGNIAQTDTATLDIEFRAVQARHNDDFTCEGCTFDEEVDLLVASAKFENPVVATPQNWNVFDSPVDGWTVEWRDPGTTNFGSQVRPEVPHLELHRGVLGSAAEGQQYAELDSDWGGPSSSGTGEPASVSIYRTYATVPGADYTLRFHFAPRPNTPAADNNLETRVEGVVEDTTGPTAGGGGPIAWQERIVTFTAADASTEIRFTDLGTSNSVGTFLDNVRLFQTSCPANGGPVIS